MLYSSVDIRESKYKLASIDTNIFPAGFNNLSRYNDSTISAEFKSFIESQFPDAESILLFCEDHTRNLYYLENIYQLSTMIEQAGYRVHVCSFFNSHPDVCKNQGYLDFKTSNDHELRVFCLYYLIDHIDQYEFDLCLLNNDLTTGDINALSSLNIPIIPHPNFGWHKRQKKIHFEYLNDLIYSMCNQCQLGIDPWLLSTQFKSCQNVSINDQADRNQLADLAADLFADIQLKYREHNIDQQPYIVLKSNNGTYGMGIVSIESPDQIIELNRKHRNKLSKGKSSIPINHVILQEGVSSNCRVDGAVSEEVVYNVNGHSIGGFYRVHNKKSDRDILNSSGMTFQSFKNPISNASKIISKCANIAAQRELTN